MAYMSDSPNARPGAAPLPEDGSDALPVGTRLAEFEIRRVLGAGGFGIVYLAWDEALHREVALKEYMPVSLAGRSVGERVTLRSRTHEEDFALGLQSFVNEARLLARFDQPALVKVFRFWEGNGTAYMAMPLYNGRTLRQLRKQMAPGALDDAWTRALIEPLLGALEVMHDAAVYHRDIAPDNILWCDDNRPVLLDFGAARLVLADRTQNVTAILKPQFAPIEQYAETQAMRQGPWTDLYALASTCYFMLTGRAPLPATARVMGDELEPLARLAPAGCSPRLLQVLDWAMAVRPQDRPQSVAQFRDALAGRIAVPLRAGAGAPAPHEDPASVSSGYEKTIQATMRQEPIRRTPAAKTSGAASSAPVARRQLEDDLERPERSVMLPPKSGLPLKQLLLLLIVATAAAGAWTTRQQWMPAVGLQTTVLAAAQGASSAEALASAAASTPIVAPASSPVAEAASAAASQALPAASDAAASVAASPASDAASIVPVAVVVAETPPPPSARPKSSTASRSKALAARIAALALPPPVLPPANESHVVTSAPAAGNATPEAVATTAAPAAPASAAPRDLGPREVCAEQGPAKMAACVKRLCDTYPRYQRYPVCQRVQRQEDQQQQRSTSE
jgi:serine/threonine protein kinase